MAEKKNFITEISQFSSTTHIGCLTLVSQGQQQTDRIGTKCTGTSLEISYFAYHRTTVTTTNLSIWNRLIIFIWKDDTTPTETMIFDPIIAVPFTNLYNAANCPLNSDLKIKRKLLYSDFWGGTGQYDVGVGAYQTSTPGLDHCRKISIPLTKLGKLGTINFAPGSTTAVNHIWYAWVSSDRGAGFAGRALAMVSRYNFIDL